MTPEQLVEITKRHVKVEDVIFDGPVCRTCRLIDGAATPYPCDAAIALTALTEAQERAALYYEDSMVMMCQRDEGYQKGDALQRQVEALESAIANRTASVKKWSEECIMLGQRVEALEGQPINALKTALGNSIVLLDVIQKRGSFGHEGGAISRQIEENKAALRGGGSDG